MSYNMYHVRYTLTDRKNLKMKENHENYSFQITILSFHPHPEHHTKFIKAE